MKGFDKKFNDFPDYILKITKEIWEDRGLHTLHDYYASDIVVRTPQGIDFGNQGVINATMGVLAEFPDRTLYAEDVIWSGTPEDGMLSSHRIISTATHKESGKKLRFRIIADCHAINNQINDEWLIRDQGAITRQLGKTPKQRAEELIELAGGTEKMKPPFTSDIDQDGPYLGKGNENIWGQKYADILTRLMQAEFSLIPQVYDRCCLAEYPGGVSGLSHGDIDTFWLGLRSSFPNAEFLIHHQIGCEDELMPPRAALRWSLTGKHEGYGHFGQPTGAEVHIMGICHAEFGPWGVRREYVLYDEVAIWQQILRHNYLVKKQAT